MMPTRVFVLGVITPGQLGPMSVLGPPRSARLTITMSMTGMPSVMQTMSGILAAGSFEDGIGGEGRGDEDDGNVGAGLGSRLHRPW